MSGRARWVVRGRTREGGTVDRPPGRPITLDDITALDHELRRVKTGTRVTGERNGPGGRRGGNMTVSSRSHSRQSRARGSCGRSWDRQHRIGGRRCDLKGPRQSRCQTRIHTDQYANTDNARMIETWEVGGGETDEDVRTRDGAGAHGAVGGSERVI